MTHVVKVHHKGKEYYAVRSTWLGMFPRYVWLNESASIWSERSEYYFEKYCLTIDLEEAKKVYFKLAAEKKSSVIGRDKVIRIYELESLIGVKK